MDPFPFSLLWPDFLPAALEHPLREAAESSSGQPSTAGLCGREAVLPPIRQTLSVSFKYRLYHPQFQCVWSFLPGAIDSPTQLCTRLLHLEATQGPQMQHGGLDPQAGSSARISSLSKG